MQLKKLNLEGVEIANNVFMAPIAGYTDGAFRDGITKLGAGLTFTEPLGLNISTFAIKVLFILYFSSIFFNLTNGVLPVNSNNEL